MEGGRQYVMLEVDSLPTPSDERMNIKITKRKKRSLDANAYHWTLCNKIAYALHSSDVEIHHELMLRYGTLLTDKEDKPVVVAISSDVDMISMNVYGRLISSDDMNHYLLIKPSRYYTPEEMNRLIEGTISEARALGIETLTPAELAQMGIGVKNDTTTENT